MADSLVTRAPRRRPGQVSSYHLLMNYEQALADTVESIIAAGLSRTRASAEVRQQVADAWREPLLIVTAEELSRRLAHQATRGPRARVSPAALRRAVAPYATLVATAARTVAARQPDAFMAAD
jgi:hypothetical protein